MCENRIGSAMSSSIFKIKDPSSIISKGISLALELRAFILKFIEVRKSKDRFLSAISDQAFLIDQLWNKLFTFNDSLTTLVDSIEDFPSLTQMDEFLRYTADAMRIYSEFINVYVGFSVAVKEFSANDYLMDNLRNYKGMLYDYVNRVSETVVDKNTIIIGGNFYRFLKAYEKDIFEKPSQKELDETMERTKVFMDKLKVKILPNLIKLKPRVLFRPKRMELLYKEPVKQLTKDREKIKIDIPEEDLIKLTSNISTPIFYVYAELVALENKVKKQRKLTYRSRFS